jgi:hypothetical protein
VFKSHRTRSAIAVAVAVTALAAPPALGRPAADPASRAVAPVVAPGVPPELRYPHAYAPAEFRSPEPVAAAPASDARIADDDSTPGWQSVVVGLALLTAFGGLGLALLRVRGPRGARIGAH